MFGLTARTAERLRQLVNRSAGDQAGQPGRGGLLQRLSVLVRCTGAAAAGGSGVAAQCYPGVIVDPHAAATTQAELAAVWLTVLGSGAAAVPAANNAVYECLMGGTFDPGSDPRPRVFGVAPAGGSDCGFFAGVTSAGWFTAATVSASGRCACVPIPQGLILYPRGGGIFRSVSNFATCIGSGLLQLDTSDPCCLPKLSILGVVAAGTLPATDYQMTLAKCDGTCAEFTGGGLSVCDDPPAAGCGDNTFRVRVCCVTNPCSDGCCPGGLPQALTVAITDPDAICPAVVGTYTARFNVECFISGRYCQWDADLGLWGSLPGYHLVGQLICNTAGLDLLGFALSWPCPDPALLGGCPGGLLCGMSGFHAATTCAPLLWTGLVPISAGCSGNAFWPAGCSGVGNLHVTVSAP